MHAPTAPALVRAAAGSATPKPPVWFMRQAGRSLPEYRALRANHGMLESCFDADLITEITMQPVRRHDVDGAILFSDIVVPLKAIGVDLDIVAGRGPVIAQPVREAAQLAQLRELQAGDVAPVLDAIRAIRGELDTSKALIGFAGAPFTLASYLVEGGPSRSYTHTKALMYGEPELWHQLLDRLAHISGRFLQLQVEAGAQLVQLFDSWAGALSRRDYVEFVQPHSRTALAYAVDVPRIHFGVGTGELLEEIGAAGASCVGIDFRVEMDDAVRRLGDRFALQGNLDPALLFAPWQVIEQRVRGIIAAGAGARGHVFNLGHGVMPETDPDVLTRIVELVHSLDGDAA
ncbi:MAG: uroporphyrinogen decarboxylase [Candidatus Nanopelagicales bacterium]